MVELAGARRGRRSVAALPGLLEGVRRHGQERAAAQALEMALVRLREASAAAAARRAARRASAISSDASEAAPAVPEARLPAAAAAVAGDARGAGIDASNPVAPPRRCRDPTVDAHTHGALALEVGDPVAPAPVRTRRSPRARSRRARRRPRRASRRRADAAALRRSSAWRAILDRVRASDPALASALEHAVPIEIIAARVVLGFEPSAAFLAAPRERARGARAMLTREVARALRRADAGRPRRYRHRPAAARRPSPRVDAERRSGAGEGARGRRESPARPGGRAPLRRRAARRQAAERRRMR